MQDMLPSVTAQNLSDQEDEIVALESIFPEEFEIEEDDLADSLPESDPGNVKHMSLILKVHLNKQSLKIVANVGPASPSRRTSPNGDGAPQASPNPFLCDAQKGMVCEANELPATSHDVTESYNVEFLPPVRLSWTFPPTYPSDSGPDYELTCSWLDAAQLQHVGAELEALVPPGSGCVIFAWADYLVNQLTSVASDTGVLRLRLHTSDSAVRAGGNEGPSGLNRRVGGCFRGRADLDGILRYNCMEQRRRFLRQPRPCALCLEDKPGAAFGQVGACGHQFCSECLSSMASTHIKEGTLTQLLCPDTTCRAAFAPACLRELVGADLMERFDQLNWKSALEAIPGLAYCPRCDPLARRDKAEETCEHWARSPEAGAGGVGPPCTYGNECHFLHRFVELPEPVPCVPLYEGDQGLYICSKCNYSFCGRCLQSYHPGVACLDDEALARFNVERMSRITKGQQTSQYRIREILGQLQSERFLKATCHNCPRCSMGVFKTEGCNKMTCLCGCFFCWRCGAEITTSNPYDHFSAGGCTVFELADVQEAQRLERVQMANRRNVVRDQEAALDQVFGPRAPGRARAMVAACPNCTAPNVKEGMNNHLVCFNCLTSFCFLCRLRLKGIKGHFNPTHPQVLLGHSHPHPLVCACV